VESFGHAQKGEWVSGISMDGAMGMGPTTAVVTYTIEKVEGDTVTVTRSSKVAEAGKGAAVTDSDKTLVFSTREAPTLFHYMGADGDLEVPFEVKQPAPGPGDMKLEVAFLVAKDVKASGIVSLRIDTKDDKGKVMIHDVWEVAGWGFRGEDRVGEDGGRAHEGARGAQGQV